MITVMEVIPYALPKTRNLRINHYFRGKKERMGGLYPIKARVYDPDNTHNAGSGVKLLSYKYHHLVVDDETSYCLPFIDPGVNW